MPKEEAFNEPEDVFSKNSAEISRRYCEPSKEIYTGSSELRDDPFKAIESVRWLGPSLARIEDPVAGLLVASAKLDTAQKELRLAPKQRGHFEGLKQNIDGAIGFLSALESTLKSKVIRRIASGTAVVSMALNAAGCVNAVGDYVEITPNTSPMVEVTNIPMETPTAFPTLEPTPAPTPLSKLEIAETLSNAGGSYSIEQLTVIDSKDFEEKVGVINNWWSYWEYAEESQRPFQPESKNIHIIPFFEKEKPESYSLAIEAKMDDGNWHTFLLPIDISKGEFRQHPPIEFGSDGIPLKIGYDIPQGFGPLEITGNIRWTESFGWIRLDEHGKMAEAINMKTGQWEEKKDLSYDFSSSINPDKIPILTKYFLYQPQDQILLDGSEDFGFPAVLADVFVVSYELVNEGSGGSMYVGLVYKNKMIKVKIDEVSYSQPVRDLEFLISKLTSEEAFRISNYLDEKFDQINNLKTDDMYYGFYRLILHAINSQSEAGKCKQLTSKYLEEMCAYNDSLDKVTSQDLINMFNNTLVPIANNQLEKFTELESTELSSSQEKRLFITLQIIP